MPTALLTHFPSAAQDKLASLLSGFGLTCVFNPADGAIAEANFDRADLVIAHVSAGIGNLLTLAGSKPVVFINESDSIRDAVNAIQAGAADYVAWADIEQELAEVVERVLARKSAGELLGDSAPIAELRGQLDKVAKADVPVVVWGESGTGKELLASILHARSTRSSGPLLFYNCAAALSDSVDADLFGSDNDPGLLARARQGSLFLDEVAALPAFAQARLVSAIDAQPDQTRIIAGARRDLRDALEEETLREDLYFRLSVVTLAVPPLRNRGDDLMTLAQDYLERTCDRLRKGKLRFSAAAIADMQRYTWPGNVRELENAIERAVILASSDEIDTELLAIRLAPDPKPTTTAEAPPADSDRGTLEDYFVAFVNEHQDTMTETEIAKSLGISRKSLWERRQRLKIPRKKSRQTATSKPAKKS
ncbi:MAG: sigma 54-interacting transcriptional regulator [Pseudomonadaceae bacterium]|nr:sigma 54-interacting transcriptional regulator [Pseudomonadaceae bacterium]